MSLQGMDLVAKYWVENASLRVRRQLAFMRSERSERGERSEFFAADFAAPLSVTDEASPGTLGWLTVQWQLSPAECWVLGLTLFSFMEGSAETLFGECLSRKNTVRANLQLAQLLWDEPTEILAFLDPAHRLRQAGLLTVHGSGWESTLSVHPNVARSLLGLEPLVPLHLRLVENEETESAALLELARGVSVRLEEAWNQVDFPWVQIYSHHHERTAELAGAVSAWMNRPFFEFVGPMEEWPSVVTWAWLQGAALMVDKVIPRGQLLAGPPVPVVKFVAAENDQDTWTYVVPPSTQAQREAWLAHHLGPELSETWKKEIATCSRRFRLGPKSIRAVCRSVFAAAPQPRSADLLPACADEARLHFGSLAQAVTFKYQEIDLVLPAGARQHFDEICGAIKNIFTRTEFWQNTGVSLMFSGPPGTGKTMAAEVLAKRMNLPMYKIDLSQVVNKYIGETEKNLSRVFDAAEESECVLFFDEADALFGRRTEVRDAHDRYANLEISYLLQRLEGFRGVVVLATNRKRDLDEAFLRRIRYVLDFAMPEARERRKLWENLLPKEILTASSLDLDFLAKNFQLTGGYIRSAIQNAYSLNFNEEVSSLSQLDLLVAIHRELEKIGRQTSADQFGPYSKAVLERIRPEPKGDLR